MKRVLFFVALGISAVITSCNHKVQVPQDLKISIVADTTINKEVPVTSPLYSCETGERRPYDKLLSMESVPETIRLSADTTISGEDLAKMIALPRDNGKNRTDWSWLQQILGWMLLIAALLLILLLLVWLLRNMWQWLFGTRNTQANANNVAIGRNNNIDQATNARIEDLERSYLFRERSVELMLSNPNLVRSTITENSNSAHDFTIVAEYNRPR